MVDPSLDELLEKVESKFALVTMVYKRARALINGAEKLVESKSKNPVSIALKEINEGKIMPVEQEEKKGEWRGIED